MFVVEIGVGNIFFNFDDVIGDRQILGDRLAQIVNPVGNFFVVLSVIKSPNK